MAQTPPDQELVGLTYKIREVALETQPLTAKTFDELPYDIKYIIWGFVLRQPRVVQVNARVEETPREPEPKDRPNYRIKLSIESCKL